MIRLRSDRKVFSTQHFTWLHVPKTGGTWLHDVLTKHAPPSWGLVGGEAAHVRLFEVPMALEHWNGVPERIGLPIIATVRNPWDWYVSLYFYLEQHRVNGTGGYALPPTERPEGLRVWTRRYAQGNDVAGFRKAMPLILEDMHRRSGYMAVTNPQTYFLRHGDGSLGVTPVRFEGLRENMIEALALIGAPIPSSLQTALRSAPAINRSGHAGYVDCYDDATRRLVAQREGWLIDTFGYRFS